MIRFGARARRAAASFAVLTAGLVGGGLSLGLVPAAVLPIAGAAEIAFFPPVTGG